MGDHTADAQVIKEILNSRKRNVPVHERFVKKSRKLFWILFSTPDTLEDMTYTEAKHYFSQLTICIFGILKRVLFVAVFTYFFIDIFKSTTERNQFIGSDMGSGVCEEVILTWNGDFLVDRNGIWKGSSGYKNNLGIYKFTFENIGFSSDSYKSTMSSIGTSLQLLGNYAKTQDLAFNMLLWSSWKLIGEITEGGFTNTQTLTLTGSPQMIMWNRFIQGTIANVSSDCRFESSYEYYAKSDANLVMGFNINSFNSDPTCNGVVDLKILGWDPLVNSNEFELQLDVTSLFTAVAASVYINGPATYDTLEITRVVVADVEFQGVTYSVFEMYDPLYPQMQPMYCLGPSKLYPINWSCLLRSGSVYGYPIFIHKGQNNTYPTRCNCSVPLESSSLCHGFDFFAGFAFYDMHSNYTSVDKTLSEYPTTFQPFLPIMELLFVEPVVSVESGNKRIFESAFAALNQGKSDSFTDSDWRVEQYEWCKTYSFGYCRLLLWRSSDDFTTIVTDNLYSIPAGMLPDTKT